MSHRTQEHVHQVEDFSQKFVIPEPTKNIGILEDEKLEKGVEELKHDETEMDLCQDQIKALSNVRDVLTEEVLELQNKLSDVKDGLAKEVLELQNKLSSCKISFTK